MSRILFSVLLVSVLLTTGCSNAPGENGNPEDKVPESFTFINQTDVEISTVTSSNTITINGINTATTISVNSGEYSLNNAAFTSLAGVVDQGDTVTLRQTSATAYLTTTDATLTVGGVSDTFSVTTREAVTPVDIAPDAFRFIDQNAVTLSTAMISNSVVVTGINAPASISISNGLYSINGTGYMSADSVVNEGDSVTIQLVSSARYSTITNATMSISGVTGTFSVTTEAEPVAAPDTTPNAFTFIDQTEVTLSTVVTSNPVVVTGINAPTSISISNGLYSINGAGYMSEDSVVNEGDSVTIKLVSSASYSTTTNATISISGVTGAFSVTTEAESVVVIDTTPDAFSFIDLDAVTLLSSTLASNPVVVTGINAPASISISNGLYSINGASYMSTESVVNEGDSVTIQLVSSASYSTATNATLTISAVTDTFSVTTEAEPGVPTEFVLPALSAGDPSFVSEHFSGSQNCSFCHNGISDNNGNDVSIITDWSSSMMANATRDPFWRAQVSSELIRNPSVAAVINDKCTRCHAPMANEEMRRNNEFIEMLGNGLLSAGHNRHDEAMEGVSCTLCHQITDSIKLGTLESFNGEFEINTSKTIYGPYNNILTQPMVNNTGYTPLFSQHIKESELCATCHNVKTPYVDEFGNVLSQTAEDEFPEQAPYTEWLHSDYANQQSCQDCHMSRTDGVVMAARPPSLSTQRNNFAVHDFIGANKMMLDILDSNRDQLGVRSSNFAETISKTDTMLASAASVQLVQSSISNGVVDFTLKVDSSTGHKLPSSYPSRRVILHVTVRDNGGNIVFESGRVNDNGSVVGLDADINRQTYEPHHDIISSSGQVQVYESIMGDNHNQVTYTLLRGMQYLKDNRLLPTGFDKSTAPADVAVKGGAFTDNNFTAGSDEVRYQISGLVNASYSVEAQLVYQTIAYAFAQDLFQESSGEVNDFHVMYNNSNLKSSVIATGQFNIN